MAHTVSIVLEHLDLFRPEVSELPLHGANLVTSALLRAMAASPDVAALEVFLPPALMIQRDSVAEAARTLLPPERRGQSVLRAHPLHFMPEVWSDGQARILLTFDPERMPFQRYLRDRFATGPTPITCDTHALGYHRLWPILRQMAGAPPVAFDSIACISEACREALRRTFGGFLAPQDTPMPARLDVLPHGVESDILQPTDVAGRAAARRLLRLPETGTLTLFLGRLTPYSKADLLPLLRAFASATDREEDRLLIVGPENTPGYSAKLREAGNALGLGDSLILRGEFDGALRPLYYAAADLFVFPGDSIQESLGSTALEAMAAGLPVIASDWDGLRDLVRHGESGYLIPTYWMPGQERMAAFSPVMPMQSEYLLQAQSVWVDTAALTEAIRALLRSPQQREAMGRAGRRIVEEFYTWPKIMARWSALWDDLTEIARAETPEQAMQRRGYAAAIGLPTPYPYLFGHYASQILDPERHGFRLSAAGLAVAERREPLQFYDETLPLLHQEIVDALFAALIEAGQDWTPMGELTGAVAAKTRYLEDDVRFHLGLLLKRDLLEMREEQAVRMGD